MAGKDLHISQLRKFGDVQRTYLFSISFLGFQGGEDMAMLARECVWPGREMEPIDSFFLGMKVSFPGKVTFSGQLDVQFEERESQIVKRTLYKWEQEVFDVTRGHSNSTKTGDEKSSLARDIKVSLLAYNGEKLPYSIVFRGCIIKGGQDLSLSMSGGEGAVIPCGFQYDWWELVDTASNQVIEFEEIPIGR